MELNRATFRAMLEEGIKELNETIFDQAPKTRYEYLADMIFDFDTYDDALSGLFGFKAIQVCEAISNMTTFDYIGKGFDNHRWYIVMVNMPFFRRRLMWGTSIRGAWWDDCKTFEFQSTGLYLAGQAITETLTMNIDQWKDFIAALIDFAREPDPAS